MCWGIYRTQNMPMIVGTKCHLMRRKPKAMPQARGIWGLEASVGISICLINQCVLLEFHQLQRLARFAALCLPRSLLALPTPNVGGHGASRQPGPEPKGVLSRCRARCACGKRCAGPGMPTAGHPPIVGDFSEDAS